MSCTDCEKLEVEMLALSKLSSELNSPTADEKPTGICSKRAFLLQLESEWNTAARSNRSLSLVLIDVDRFTRIDGPHERMINDHVLKQVGSILHDYARDCDFLGRYSNQEFAVILPRTDAPGAVGLAERFRAMIERELRDGAITASLGIATSLVSVVDAHALVIEADRALHHAKASGGNRVSHIQVLEPIQPAVPVNRAVRNSK